MQFRIIFFLILIVFNGEAQTSTEKIPTDQLSGKWYLQLTNIPKLTNPEISSPYFDVVISEKKSKNLKIYLNYRKKGKEKKIRGKVNSVDLSSAKFKWKGKGRVFFMRKQCEIVYVSEDTDWMIIEMKKTLIRPEGVFIVGRNENLNEEVRRKMAEKLDELGLNSELSVPNKEAN